MYGILKFLVSAYRAGLNLLDPEINPLRYAPIHVKYFASIILSCLWALAFGCFIGELMVIGYSMIGHICVVTMAFGTWVVFKYFTLMYKPRSDYELLRDPNRQPKCYDLTDEEREQALKNT
jgi:hypothetical protein